MVYDFDSPDLLLCESREQPEESYSIVVNILTPGTPKPLLTVDSPKIGDGTAATAAITQMGSYWWVVWLVLGLLFVILAVVYFRKKKAKPATDLHLIAIGAYKFDQRNMELSLNEEKIDLTSKEADLLTLLHNSVNTTLAREVILKMVWGDEGDYVGRTLDVFISKLRKKLEADASVKIVNIRGVGYKLVLNS
jgi:hypothetical protein